MKDAPLGAPSPSLLARGETGESDDGPTRGLDQTIRVAERWLNQLLEK
jgi:hypothetical protein